VKNTEGCNMKI